ncbi:lipopolysaccharide biosynthesis protein [Bradyrhizobium elkanii]|uniref:lipopolysaccharide biosynthesis protein n=1 Tax=Bradyrhizobium elkanii TaxID=29448 RepID=UPI001FEE5B96|nr:lipopolysaccharide biosynthesis protein [Bradyrhizobium elkanii]
MSGYLKAKIQRIERARRVHRNERTDQYFADNKPYSGLGRRSLHSGVAFIAARGLNIFVQLASTIVLARLLGPHDFGLVAMMLALIGFAPLFVDLGMSEASAQRNSISRAEVSTLFWLNVLIGVVLAVVLAASGRWIARAFGEPSLAGMALALSVTFLMMALSTQHYALMRRAMQFRRIAMIDISANIIGSAASVGLALSGWGYWALIAKPIITSALTVVGAWTACRWIPGGPRLTPMVKELLRFGLGVTGFTMTDYFARSADRIAMGYFLGAGPLGYFQNAFTIYNNLLSILSEPLHNIAVSGLSKLQHSAAELKRSWEGALSLLCYFSGPAFAALAVSAHDIVIVLLGEKWSPAGPLLCILAIRGIADCIERTLGWVHVAVGRPDRWMRWGIFSAICQLVALAAGLPFGAVGVTIAYTVTMFVLFVPALVYAGKPVGITIGDVLRATAPQTIAALVAVAVAFSIQEAFLQELPRLLRIPLASVICVTAYLTVVVGVFRITRPLQLAWSLLRDFGIVRLQVNS